ncbi:MAG: glycosyltransferase family 39 protein [bacterium]|nr:glycosyltransferase family 39 protein [bacterium]
MTILLIIVILGFTARLYKIDNPVADWHSWRQGDTASVTRNMVDSGINLLYPKYHDLSLLQTGKDNPEGYRFVEVPIFNAIHATLYKAYPAFSLEKWGRLLSAIVSTISIVFMYLLGKKYLGVAGGLLSAFLFAFLPFNIYFSRVILPDPTCVTLSLAFLWFYTEWLDKKKLATLVVSGVLLSSALLVKPYAIFFAIPAAWLTFREFGSRMFKRYDLYVFAVFSFLPLILWRFHIARYPEGIPFYKWMFNMEGIRFKPAFWRWIFGERIGRMILGLWGLVPFGVGLISKTKDNEKYFSLAMFAGAFAYLSILAAANVRHDYYQTLIIPGVVFVTAKGALELWNNNSFNKWLSRALVVSSILFALGFSWYDIKELYKINHPEIVRAGEALQKYAEKDAKVLAPYHGDTALLYQTKRNGWPEMTYAVGKHMEMGAKYFVSVNLEHPDTLDIERKYITLEKTDKYIIIKLEPKPRTP